MKQRLRAEECGSLTLRQRYRETAANSSKSRQQKREHESERIVNVLESADRQSILKSVAQKKAADRQQEKKKKTGNGTRRATSGQT